MENLGFAINNLGKNIERGYNTIENSEESLKSGHCTLDCTLTLKCSNTLNEMPHLAKQPATCKNDFQHMVAASFCL